MKRAVIAVATVWVNCPCGAELASPNSGSLGWEAAEIGSETTTHCQACGEDVQVRLPKRVAV
jgi:hypothetical protein